MNSSYQEASRDKNPIHMGELQEECVSKTSLVFQRMFGMCRNQKMNRRIPLYLYFREARLRAKRFHRLLLKSALDRTSPVLFPLHLLTSEDCYHSQKDILCPRASEEMKSFSRFQNLEVFLCTKGLSIQCRSVCEISFLLSPEFLYSRYC